MTRPVKNLQFDRSSFLTSYGFTSSPWRDLPFPPTYKAIILPSSSGFHPRLRIFFKGCLSGDRLDILSPRSIPEFSAKGTVISASVVPHRRKITQIWKPVHLRQRGEGGIVRYASSGTPDVCRSSCTVHTSTCRCPCPGDVPQKNKSVGLLAGKQGPVNREG